MTTLQKVIHYLAMAFAILLIVSILGGILSAVGLFGGFGGKTGVAEEWTEYPLTQNITALQIEINAADLTITAGDSFAVKSNLKHLTVQEKNGTLVIAETKKGLRYNGAGLELCIPRGTTFTNAGITTGAGKLTADALVTERLRLELGAGAVAIKTLTATAKAEIEGGAGKLDISGGVLQNLDLEMGVGELNLISKLTGNSELDYGIGESNLTLVGTEADYRIEIEKGVGSVTVAGKKVQNEAVYGNGQNNVEINCGVGTATVDFEAVYGNNEAVI